MGTIDHGPLARYNRPNSHAKPSTGKWPICNSKFAIRNSPLSHRRSIVQIFPVVSAYSYTIWFPAGDHAGYRTNPFSFL